ncbi:DUF1176 domain-containing protein [Acidisoma sp. 7E03]
MTLARLFLASGLCLAAPALVRAAAPPVQSYDSYKSWLVACDNTLSCEAKGFSQNGDRTELTILRDAGPGGHIRALFASETPFTANDPQVDGTGFTLGPAWKAETSAEDGTTFVTEDEAAIRALVQAIRNGSEIELPGDKAIPLDGFTAALRRMDARQGRTGTVTALLDTGPNPAQSVPPALPVPLIPHRPITAKLEPGEAARLIATTRKSGAAVLDKEECDAQVEGMDPAAYALDRTTALVLIPCIMGAYQGSYIGFLTDRATGATQEVEAPIPYQSNEEDRASAADLTEGDFDPATGILSMAAKGRGLGDCGLSASWIWDGHAFQLSAMALQDSCGGMEAGDWPTLFRSQQ